MTEKRPRLLLIDDGPTYAEALSTRLPEFELAEVSPGMFRAPDGPSALAYLAKHANEVDAVLLDMHFDVPEQRLLPLAGSPSLRRRKRFQGLAILDAVRNSVPRLPVVLLTAEEDLALSEANHDFGHASLTYVLEGEDLDSLRIQLHSALTDAAADREEHGILWGDNLAMASLRRRLAVVSRGRLPVILEGETGTGKSFLAEHYVHRKSGRSGAFVILDLATVPSELISAHLFGATKGAYTGAVSDRVGVFEAAHGGTLFIDEIQNVPLEVQKQLLLVLQDGRLRRLGSTRDVTVDVKVIAASNRSLRAAVDEGRFRADLYMRLSPATSITILPLREHIEDLPFLLMRFAERACDDPDLRNLASEIARAMGCPDVRPRLLLGLDTRESQAGDNKRGLELLLPRPALQRLQQHRWPGNLRELSTMVHNLVAFTLVGALDALTARLPLSSPRLQIDAALVDLLLSGASGSTTDHVHPNSMNEHLVRVTPAPSLNDVSQDVERQVLRQMYQSTGGDFAEMAKRLLGDDSRGRAVRLRFNQLGLRVRDLKSDKS